MIPILIALLLVASFVVCYYSSFYWHWSHVLVVELVFLFGVGYFFVAAENWRIRRVFGNKIASLTKQVEQTSPLVDALKFGTRDEGVIAQLEGQEVPVVRDEVIEDRMVSVGEIEHELKLVTRSRGRVWRDVQGVAIDHATMTATLAIEFPQPHGIVADSILYAFEEGPAPAPGEQGPQYIGELRVVAVSDNQIRVTPTSPLGEREAGRLASSRRPWILYENMPADQHPDGLLEIFAGATPEELREMLPPESVEEYVRHGSPRQPDDEEWEIEGYDESGNLVTPDNWGNNTIFRYRRQLRDYNYLFQEIDKRVVAYQADKNGLIEDNKQLLQSLASAKQVQAAYEERKRKLTADLEGVTRDRQAIEAHLDQVQTQLANAQQLLEATRAENLQMTQQLLSR